MKKLPRKIYAGICDGQIYACDCPDKYAPVAIAIYENRAEAEKHFETVLEIDGGLLATGETGGKKKRPLRSREQSYF